MSEPGAVVVAVAGVELHIAVATTEGRCLPVTATVEPCELLPETSLVRLRADADATSVAAAEPAALSIRWAVPAIDMHGFYSAPPSPDDLARLPFWHVERRTAAHTGVPFFSLFH